MRESLVGILVVAAMLVVGTSTARADSTPSFQATCSANGGLGFCGGGYSDGSFVFSGPFVPFFGSSDVTIPLPAAPGYPLPLLGFGIGTNGGSFIYSGSYCDYGVAIGGGGACDGSVIFGSTTILAPSDTGLSPGAVVSVVGPATVQGFFCEPCTDDPTTPLVVDINVTATYQFTLTAPGTISPWSWTGAEFTSLPPTPEPSGFLLFGTGLLLFGIIVCRK
jgi:hypothetical protein